MFFVLILIIIAVVVVVKVLSGSEETPAQPAQGTKNAAWVPPATFDGVVKEFAKAASLMGDSYYGLEVMVSGTVYEDGAIKANVYVSPAGEDFTLPRAFAYLKANGYADAAIEWFSQYIEKPDTDSSELSCRGNELPEGASTNANHYVKLITGTCPQSRVLVTQDRESTVPGESCGWLVRTIVHRAG